MSVSEVERANEPATLTKELFADSVLDLRPRIAVFDCDGTLWSGDAGSRFMRWTIETGLVSREAIDWIEGRYRMYLAGEVSELEICGEMVQMYGGLQESELRAAARAFVDEFVQPNIFPEMRDLVEALKRSGTEIWAVSSTNDWVIEEGVRSFGIPAERVLAARVRSAGGRVTDELLDVPTDEGKVSSLLRVGVTAPDAVFGNSVHDAAMLELAKRAFPVNPTAGLLEISASKGWPVFRPEPIPVQPG